MNWLRARSVVPQAVHGALDYAELAHYGLTPEDVIDFSENTNPFGPPPAVVEAMSSVDPAPYPDRECLALRRVLCKKHGCKLENVVVGNGAAELIWFIGFTLLQKDDRVAIVGPTFGEYERTARLMGAQVLDWQIDRENGFQIDVAKVSALLSKDQPHLIFLCNPNNPTGTIVDLSVIDQWAQQNPQTLFVIDEAYIDFVIGMQSAFDLRLPNVFVIRSMTKAFALAGIRLGYALGSETLIHLLAQVRIPWSVSRVAQETGVAVLNDRAYLSQTMTKTRVAKDAFATQLTEAGLSVFPSAANFFLVDVARIGESGRSFRQKLLKRGIVVRDCTSFGLPSFVRLSVRKPLENDRCTALIAKSLPHFAPKL